MDIQWPLVFFTVLSGAGSCLIALVAVNEFLGKTESDKIRTIALITGIILVIAGGIASSQHLSHVDRIMGALSNSKSGIFIEAALTGVIVLLAIIYLVMARRGVSRTAVKVVAAITGVIGVIYPFATSTSYMLASRPEWNTVLFPIVCFSTSALTGVTSYLVIQLTDKSNADDGVKSSSWILMLTTVFSLISAASVIAYVVTIGEFAGDQKLLLWGGILAAGCILPLACSLLARKGNSIGVLSITALIGSFVGSFSFRCFMWLITASYTSLVFGSSLFGTF